MEYRLIFDDDEEIIGDFSPAEILSLTDALSSAHVFDVEGNMWVTGASPQLYFNSYPPYFYLSLRKKE